MRFSRTLGTSAMFLSAVCWSFSDTPIFYLPSVDAELKPALRKVPETAAMLTPLREKVASDLNHSSHSYPLHLQLFGAQVVATITVPAIGEQLIEIDLTHLHHQKKLSSKATTHLEKLLSLLARKHSSVRIHFEVTTQTITMFSGTSVIETEVMAKDTARDDLPVLLEEDAVKQMFLAVECAETAGLLSEVEIHSCYSGSIQYLKDDRLTFELKPEYLSIPASLETYQTDSSLQFPLNATTQVVLILNNNGTIAWGDTYSLDTDTSSGTPRTASPNKGKKSKNKKNFGGASKKTVLFCFGVGSGSQGMAGAVSGAGGGEPPEDPNWQPDRKPSSPVIFSDDDEEENSDEATWFWRLMRSDEREDYLESLSSDERTAFLKSLAANQQGHESGYISSEPLDDYDSDELHLPKGHKSQWGDGDRGKTDQRSRANKDYVRDGQHQKLWDSSNN